MISAGYKVNDLTELKALVTSDKLTGYARLVSSIPAWFSYDSGSSTASDDINVILPDSGTGRWLRAPKVPSATEVIELSEYIDDRVANLLQQGSNITITYNDTANTLTIASSGAGYTSEEAQDAVGGILTDTSTIDLTYNDSSNQITAAIIAGSITNSLIAASAGIDQTKVDGLVSALSGKATTSHTHISTHIGDFSEAVQDVVGGFLVQGSNITLDYNDGSNTLTISATSSGGGGGGLGDWDDLYTNAISGWDSEY